MIESKNSDEGKMLIDAVEKCLDEFIRPALASHGGDVELLALEDKVLRLKLLGQCSACPSAMLTMEEFIEPVILNEFPDVVERVVMDAGISDELWDEAKRILASRGK